MKELTWYYPTRLEEATDLLRDPGIVPHGGGTGLLRAGLGRFTGLVDLRRLPVHDFRAGDGYVEIGAGLTFADAAARMAQVDPDSVLVKALSRAAATPLRDRITVGGSVAMAPPWSDLLGPLLALDAEVLLAGAESGVFPVSRYLDDRSLRKGTLVTGVRLAAGPWRSRYVRATATHFDYASFTLTVMAKVGPSGAVDDLRLAVVGAKQSAQRLTDLERKVKGRKAVRSTCRPWPPRPALSSRPKLSAAPSTSASCSAWSWSGRWGLS